MQEYEVIQGDCIEKMQSIRSSSIDLIIADPPYNLGKNYGNDSDDLEFEEYLTFSKCWLMQADRVLKDSGSIYVFMGFKFISYLYQILAKDIRYQFGNWICWHYTQGLGKKKGFSPRHDDILLFHKSKKTTFNLDDIRIPQKYYRKRNNMRGANPGDVWEFSHVHYCNENRQNHPTQKPEGVIERMVLASSNKNDTVLDPFSGSGTTLRVCQQTARKCIGIELNSSYISDIQNRLNKPFSGFDSIDQRINRVPEDFRDKNLLLDYLHNHEKWFLKNHENMMDVFHQQIKKVYGIEVFNLFLSSKINSYKLDTATDSQFTKPSSKQIRQYGF